jgi:hypothetical protein
VFALVSDCFALLSLSSGVNSPSEMSEMLAMLLLVAGEVMLLAASAGEVAGGNSALTTCGSLGSRNGHGCGVKPLPSRKARGPELIRNW